MSEADDEIEYSESGGRIYRHKERVQGFSPPSHPGKYLDEISDHIEKHFGPYETVLHEIVSDLIHLDVHVVPPSDERDCILLITSGVSDEPMNVPEGMEAFRRVELVVALPSDWPITEEALKDESNYWPIRWLKSIGRLPHEYQTWIGWGHTIPNGDPAEPIADTRFIGFMVTAPHLLPHEFFQLTTSDGETISFFTLTALYREEMEFKLKKGAEALEEKLDDYEGGFVIDPTRPNTAAKKRWRIR